MKIRLLLSLLAFFAISLTATYASFPVEQKTENTAVVKKQNAELTSPAAVGGSKSQIVAALLCFFLGGIGVHRFYLGYTWQGIVQLLTGGGCGVWALIDLIRICTGNLGPKDGSYDKTF